MNLTRLSCISPTSWLRATGSDRKNCSFPHIQVLTASIRLRTHNLYYYFKVQQGDLVWAGRFGRSDEDIPEKSPWRKI